MSFPDRAIVIFGGNGDLSLRMLLPSLYALFVEGHLPGAAPIIGVGRETLNDETYRERVGTALKTRAAPLWSEDRFASFAQRLHYLPADATDPQMIRPLHGLLGGRPAMIYFSTSPTLYEGMSRALKAADLVTPQTRLAVEKPIGRDLETSRRIDQAFAEAFSQSQIFRVDHYLGKETVQNLLALRFGNSFFEPLWNNRGIDYVEITVAETEGVGNRWKYYDDYGALRDMVQNHIMQLLCLVAMEPPADLDPEAIAAEKIKVLRALRPIHAAGIERRILRGQYGDGYLGGETVPGYVAEKGAPSATETFLAVQADIDNWRWSGVPFLLRTGKRLAVRRTEILIHFKQVPHSIFADSQLAANRLLIRLQPEEDISLQLMNLEAEGALGKTVLRPMPLSLTLAKKGIRRRIAYERLFFDALHDRRTLFVNREEIDLAWRWVDGIAASWTPRNCPLVSYPAGSWGPRSDFTDRFAPLA
jgi:glucose-6-phosphate 1-dehydrogenase